ncbi:hypothetical protein DS745_22345 [Anaerobacillus alkaliphilus]|uniref:Collagen-like protein n=1 Tax=Anaerobacillus alkaliphilus TaxID=1548597 RepID=A0A4Q0VMU6_9BACI|nr:hypothetical protein [Anaerobacillus alkaliphilus]RXI96453.1 hypothetical protein DS745_22345 [Anaerobacillus alkaliphilus]
MKKLTMSIAVATLLLAGVAGCGADNQTTGLGTNNYQANHGGMFGAQGTTGQTGVTGQGRGLFGGQGDTGQTGITGRGGGLFGGQGATGQTGVTGRGGGLFGGQGTGTNPQTGIGNDGYYGLPSYDIRGFDERALGGLGRGLDGIGNGTYGGQVIGGQTDETTPTGLERHGSYSGQRGMGTAGMNR